MTDLSAWPALVLTAGLATRLRPLSNVRAKAALPVAGTPLVVRILEWLRAAGVTRVVLNLHHRPETVTAAVGDGSRWGMTVRYSWEREVLGSAGGPRRALPLLDAERFLIVNGDTLTDCDLPRVVGRHLATRALVTMALVPGDVARYGGAVVDASGYITGFARAQRAASPGTAPAHRTAPVAPVAPSAPTHRTAPVAPNAPAHRTEPVAPIAPVAPVLHFIGVQAVESRAFESLRDDEPSETIRTLYPALIASHPGAIAAFQSDAEFLDVGTPRDYLETVALIAGREQRPFDRGRSVVVAPDATVAETVLWDRVTVGRGARLRRCVVADDVSVADGAVYEDQVLVAGASGPQASPL
jgi:NDP-sugar pyrophosphorylase family protein